MWGYSFEDLARRAQEEAARLAEQASSSTGFLNLDSMNPDGTSPSNNDDENNHQHADNSPAERLDNSLGTTRGLFGFSTPQNTSSSFFHGHSTAVEKSAPHTAPPATTKATLGESDTEPFAMATSTATTEAPTTSAARVHTTPIVTKLPSATESDDFDPDSWGEDDDDIFDDPDNDDNNSNNNVNEASRNDDKQQQLSQSGMMTIAEDSDEMAERMREESRKLAQQIMLEEEQRMKEQEQIQEKQQEEVDGSQHPEGQADNEKREPHNQQQQEQQQLEQTQEDILSKSSMQETYMIDPSDLEAEQLREQSRLAAEAIMKGDLVEECRPEDNDDQDKEWMKGEDEVAAVKAEDRSAKEATLAEEVKIAEEEAAAEEERQRLEEKRLAEEARLAEEEAAAEAERQRLEEERLAEGAKIAEEKAAAEEERQRLEEEQLAEEAKIAEEEAAAETERQRLEEERLAEEAKLAEEEVAAEAERQRLEEERLAEETRLAEEEAVADAERQRLEEERLAEEAKLAEEEVAAETERQRLEEERLAEETKLDEEEAAAEEERQRLEEERLAGEDRLAEKEAAAEEERQRLEEERLAEEAKIAEEEAAAETERQRLEEERLAEEARLAEEEAAAEEERQRLEEERLAEEARLAEEEALADAERQRLEEERLAEETRLAEEEAAADAKRQRLKEERLAEEARLAEEEAAAEEERQRLEEDRLAEEAKIAEEEAAAEAECQRLEEERLAEEARLAEEEALADAERQRLEKERLAEEVRLAEEEAATEEERQRLEEERLAEKARLAEEEEAAAEEERQRLEKDRLAEEARLAEEEAAGAASLQRLEEEHFAEEARLAEEEAAAEAERQRLEEDRLSEEARSAEKAKDQWLEEQLADEANFPKEDASAEAYRRHLEEEKSCQERLLTDNDNSVQVSCETSCIGENVAKNDGEDDFCVGVNEDDFNNMHHEVGDSHSNVTQYNKCDEQEQSGSQFVGTQHNDTEDTSPLKRSGLAHGMNKFATGESMDQTKDAYARSSLHNNESEQTARFSVERTESIKNATSGTETHLKGDCHNQNIGLGEKVDKPNHRGSVDSSLQQNHSGQRSTKTNAAQPSTQSSSTPSLQSLFGSHASQLLEASNAATNMFSWGFNAHTVAKTVEGANNEGAPFNNEDTTSDAVMQNSNDDGIDDSGEMCAGGNFDDMYNDNELDDMYDDDEETDDEIEANIQNSETEGTILKETNSEEGDFNQTGQDSPGKVPQDILDNFMKQLERMNESHQLEMSELQRNHNIEVERLQNELSTERGFKNKAKARAEVASQDKYLGQMRELEKKFNASLKMKEDELEEVIKRNEGMTLKMDSMKREVEGLAKIVDERDDEICRLKKGHGTTIMQVEGKVKISQEELTRKDAEIIELKSSMSSMKADLESTSESYDTLKARAKTIATELKDRRVEVRTLTAQNEELRSFKVSLETQVANLRALVNQHELSISYKDKDMEVLNEKMKEMTKQLEGKDKSLQDRSAVGEKAIASYKRKAQEALAAANARLASANQAREEAESDAKSAKLAADDAVERARMAEARRVEAEKSRNELASQLEEERLTRSKEIAELRDSVEKLNDTIDLMQAEANEAHAAREKLIKEKNDLGSKLAEEREKSSDLREKLIEEKTLCDSLQREVHDLHDEVQRSSAAAFKRAQNKVEQTQLENGSDNSTGQNLPVDGTMKLTDRSEADGTIIMLQQELQGANDAIMELKLALRTALLEKTERGDTLNADYGDYASASQNEDNLVGSRHNDNTPLFFAIEKQNELNTAREEINRLASMLGDAESEKQEAFDAMEEMRQKMDEANARLLRYEKLGMKAARPQHNNSASSSYGPFRGIGSGSSYSSAPRGSVADFRPPASSGHDSVVNLEYLKNVMLSYLKARTLAERRKLVPVIGTVLCLTPEEQAQAVDSVEQSAGLGGVASSFWENLESKAHNFM